MSDLLGNLSQNRILQEISAGSPEQLAKLIRQIRVPMQIVQFVAVPGKYTCFFRSHVKIQVKKKDVSQVERLRDGD